MPPERLELSTSTLKRRALYQLSYEGVKKLTRDSVSDPRVWSGDGAVGAANLALGDLILQNPQAAAPARQRRDLSALRPDVIELEHEKVRLLAVDAASP
jgi:hypothetical protein